MCEQGLILTTIDCLRACVNRDETIITLKLGETWDIRIDVLLAQVSNPLSYKTVL